MLAWPALARTMVNCFRWHGPSLSWVISISSCHAHKHLLSSYEIYTLLAKLDSSIYYLCDKYEEDQRKEDLSTEGSMRLGQNVKGSSIISTSVRNMRFSWTPLLPKAYKKMTKLTLSYELEISNAEVYLPTHTIANTCSRQIALASKQQPLSMP